MSNTLLTDQGIEISEGSIVILARFPNMKWILHQGWYTYSGNQYMGWYFSSIPSNTILPVSNDDLIGIQVVSGCGSCPPPVPCPPIGPGPGTPPPGEPFTHDMRIQLERAWITVDTIEQRNRLNIRLVPDGKVVKVNDVDGKTKYYSYDQSTSTWVEEVFGLDGTFVKKDELPHEVYKLIEGNNTIRQSIQTIAQDSTKWYNIQE